MVLSQVLDKDNQAFWGLVNRTFK